MQLDSPLNDLLGIRHPIMVSCPILCELCPILCELYPSVRAAWDTAGGGDGWGHDARAVSLLLASSLFALLSDSLTLALSMPSGVSDGQCRGGLQLRRHRDDWGDRALSCGPQARDCQTKADPQPRHNQNPNLSQRVVPPPKGPESRVAA